MHTDGVTEARSATGEQFGEARLVDTVVRFTSAGEAAPEALRLGSIGRQGVTPPGRRGGGTARQPGFIRPGRPAFGTPAGGSVWP
ncbi:SpoIIE family protein phosphatase [Streptomyces nojiriensis]